MDNSQRLEIGATIQLHFNKIYIRCNFGSERWQLNTHFWCSNITTLKSNTSKNKAVMNDCAENKVLKLKRY